MFKEKHLYTLILIIFSVCHAVVYVYAGEVQRPAITVTGKAEIRIVPDAVDIMISVEKWNQDIWKAKKENDDVVYAIEQVFKKYCIEQKHIRIHYLNITPRYDDYYKKDKFLGYFINRSILVTLNDLTVFDALITDLFTAGITSINSICFKTTKLQVQREKAQKMAIRAAKMKARRIVKEIGIKIGAPLSIIEETEPLVMPPYGVRAWPSNEVYTSPAVIADNYDTLFPGEIAVCVIMRVTFEIEE